MGNKKLRIALLISTLVLLMSACDVHEFPEQVGSPQVTLHLHLPLDTVIYKEIAYALESAENPSRARSEEMMIRYRVKGWLNLPATMRGDASTYGRADYEADFYGGTLSHPDTVININRLDPGEWTFITWADVCDGRGNSLSHNADDFSNITVQIDAEGMIRNSQQPLAWRGQQQANVALEYNRHIFIDMEQPQGYFRFITTDIDAFIEDNDLITRYGVGQHKGSKRTLDLNDYSMVFYVDGYYPSAFDNFINKPVDAHRGCFGTASITNHGDGTANLGGLHTLVNGSEASLRIVGQVVHRADGAVVGQTMPVSVPMVRGKVTIVKGPFLTSKAKGGLYVNPDFDGEFNIFIQ